MKHWVKVVRKASMCDKLRIGKAILLIEAGKFPADTIQLKGTSSYRTRVGDWRIEFHYENGIVALDGVRRRDENTYK